ncbi:MAG: hypothetical protein CM1200mP24_08940 [Gammaproteobacteria bacterium]|nr:MAG: hypothetical protein CM1200mP24_08940 [Gammaproteobacteria bacterium]
MASQDALDALPITWDKGEHAKASSSEYEAIIDAGLTADEAFVGNEAGDAEKALAVPAKQWKPLRLSIPKSCAHGTHERHGCLDRGQM